VTTFLGDGPFSNILVTGDSARGVTLWASDRKNAFILRTDELGAGGTMRSTLPSEIVKAILEAKPGESASARIDFGESSVSAMVGEAKFIAEPVEKRYPPIEKVVGRVRQHTPTIEFVVDRKEFVQRIRGLRAGRRGRGRFDVVISPDGRVRMAQDDDDTFFVGSGLAKAVMALRGRRMSVTISRLREGFIARLVADESEALVSPFHWRLPAGS
jgi:hypothetical protein